MIETRSAPQLTNPIAMDDAICFNTPDGGVLIEPTAKPVQWVAFALVAAILVLTTLLALLSLVSIDFSILGLLGWMFRNTILVAIVGALAATLYPQWQALRRPVVSIVPADELIEIVRAHSTRRIPFPVVVSLRIAGDPVEQPLDRVQNIIFERLQVPRRGVGLVLKHGEVVWCGVISGKDARERARHIRQRISLSISGSATPQD